MQERLFRGSEALFGTTDEPTSVFNGLVGF